MQSHYKKIGVACISRQSYSANAKDADVRSPFMIKLTVISANDAKH